MAEGIGQKKAQAEVLGHTEYRYETSSSNPSHQYLCPAIEDALAGLPDRARVLDIGCGNGSLTAAWARAGWDVTGVDLSESGIAHARAAYPNIAFHRLPVGQRLMDHFGEGTFEAIVSAEVVEHLYAPRDLAQCAFRLLKNDGLLILTTPYHGYLKNLALAATGKMDQHWTVLWDGGHIKFWSWRTIRVLLDEAGFEAVRFQGAGRVPYFWKSMVVSARKGLRAQTELSGRGVFTP